MHLKVKAKKRNQTVGEQSLKIIFWKFENSPWEHYMSKKMFYFLNNFLYFQTCNYKIFMKIHHVSRVLYMFKTLKKNMWTSGFLYQKSFSLFKCSWIVSIFLANLIYSSRTDPCVQNIQKIKIHIPF
jgi:hypothetical protein